MNYSQAHLELLYSRNSRVIRHEWQPMQHNANLFTTRSKNGNSINVRLYVEAHDWCGAGEIAAALGIHVNLITPILSGELRRGTMKRRGARLNYRYCRVARNDAA